MSAVRAAATPTDAKGAPAQPGLERQEARLAFLLFLPTVLIVLAVVLLPLLANFWISFKPVELADLRAPTVFVNEQVRGRPEAPGAEVTLEYRLRNSSQDQPIRSVVLEDVLPSGLTPAEIDPRCTLEGGTIRCEIGDVAAGFRDRLRLRFVTGPEYFDAAVDPETSVALVSGTAENVLTSFSFTLENYRRVFEAREFWDVLRVTVLYTVFGTIGSLVLGLFAAQLLNASFRGRGLLRGLFLFPYVAPVIAVAFTWVFMLDPFSGTVNALTTRLGVAATPVNFLGTRSIDVSLFGLTFGFPLALAMVIAFESWRYFPLAFLFILARLQALPSDIYEAAEIDGATPLQTFWYVTLPQLVGILSVLFLLRFIWTFNKFDDIFLLTGGAAGTRTLTVSVYEQGFALGNIGAGAAVSVVIFVVLLVFALLYFRFAPKERG